MEPISLHILVIDDDAEICLLIKKYLEKHSIKVTIRHNTDDIRAIIEHENIDLILLDVMMPEVDGLEVCKQVRQYSDIFIIMISAMGEDVDRIVGLEVGADDYLSKPFNPRELLARIKSLVRRSTFSHEGKKNEISNDYSNIIFSGWLLDRMKRVLISSQGILIPLTSGEFNLLVIFLNNSNKLLTRDFLLNKLHSRDAGPFDRTIDVQIGRIRKKIEIDPKNPKLLTTIRGGGYIFNAEVSYE